MSGADEVKIDHTANDVEALEAYLQEHNINSIRVYDEEIHNLMKKGYSRRTARRLLERRGKKK
jgi:hypothetical protein